MCVGGDYGYESIGKDGSVSYGAISILADTHYCGYVKLEPEDFDEIGAKAMVANAKPKSTSSTVIAIQQEIVKNFFS